MLRSLDRHRDGERRAGAGTTRPLDLAAVLLGDLTRDRQAETGALGLGGEELLEESAADLLVDAWSAVAHRDLHVVLDAAGRHGDAPTLGQRLEPVLDQVEDGLAQEGA